MEEIFLPVLHSFENNNVFTGSYGALRFKVTPAITMKKPEGGRHGGELHALRALARAVLL